ncbi:hypothetical protein Peur_050421 [Populus x canadensis]
MYGLEIIVAFNQLRFQSAYFSPRYGTPPFPSLAYQFEASEDEGVMEERAASFSIYHVFVLCSCILEKMSCLSSCKKIALAYSPCQTRRIIKWLAIGLSQSSYRFYSMLATFALKDYRLVAPNRAKSMELSFYTVDDAMLVELQSSKLVDQISEIYFTRLIS